ncbi:dTDP-4-dehydrorhamnose 3,5-epimerase family protein [Streptomyces aurantiacus]|uniref:dTDP-4-dehydrorhamnose 3,5-epimerase n=1 Tax=Streptomyces aurantiacus TaxID=47760 RepID=A0A7G1PAU7_9ACTN|nr:dTDP-4-dehydrorhamnose 3,5-epimerase [Streptomyces aurantiacus]MDQ0779147.1 epimerase EvaD [Streptomyces aurantiacus]BCL32538.1 dTDP-4-dehydrorhamnose 3,5-epimerase [Streptomyces aurantiacus]
MRTRRLAVVGGFEFTPEIHTDARGLFVSPLQEEAFVAAVGERFVTAQTNHSRSARGVLRGLHFTTAPPGQAKYVYCAQGRALDAVVDLRLGSPTFGKWDMVEMDAVSYRAVYIPDGVGHAFLALDDDTVMSYLVSTAYRAEFEQAIDPLDPALGLPWPYDMRFLLSERDTVATGLAEAQARGMLPRYEDCRQWSASSDPAR